MERNEVLVNGKKVMGVVSSFGSFNLVWIQTDLGMVGCGAFDVMALDKFSYPAARVKSLNGAPISTVNDVLDGIIKDANEAAKQRGIEVGMSGREAIRFL